MSFSIVAGVAVHIFAGCVTVCNFSLASLSTFLFNSCNNLLLLDVDTEFFNVKYSVASSKVLNCLSIAAGRKLSFSPLIKMSSFCSDVKSNWYEISSSFSMYCSSVSQSFCLNANSSAFFLHLVWADENRSTIADLRFV